MAEKILESGRGKTLVGMVHLPPLPGSPGLDDMDAVKKRALSDADRLAEAGMDALLVENYGDTPFLKDIPEEAESGMNEAVKKISEEVDLPIGVNVLRNDWKGALSMADELDLSFIRVNVYTGVTMTDAGMIEGQAGKIRRYISNKDIDAQVFADVHVKHGKTIYPSKLKRAAESACYRGKADAVIVTGRKTGGEPELEDVKIVKDAVGCPVLVGSGLDHDNVSELLRYADGGIVGTSIKLDGKTSGPVSLERAKEMVAEIQHLG